MLNCNRIDVSESIDINKIYDLSLLLFLSK